MTTPKTYKLFELCHDAVVVTDEQWRIRYRNEAAARLFAYDGELETARLDELPCLKKYPQLFRQLRELPPTCGSWAAPAIWVGSRGVPTDATIERSQLYLEENGFIWFFSSRKADAVGPTSPGAVAEMYQNLVELASDGICIIREETIAYANPQLAEMLGVAVVDLVGQRFGDFIAPSSRDVLQDMYRSHLEGGRNFGVIETGLMGRDGRRIDAELDAAIIPFENEAATLVTLHDVSERKRSERALRASEEKYRLVTESSMDIIWAYDTEKPRFEFLSQALQRVLGWEREEVARLTLRDLLMPGSRRRLVEAFQAAIDAWPERQDVSIEVEHRHRDGHGVWLEVHGSLIPREDGLRPVLMAGVSRDVTERRAAERALRYQTELLQLVAEIATDFIYLDTEEIGAGIDRTLAEMCETIGANHVCLFTFNEETGAVDLPYEWAVKGLPRVKEGWPESRPPSAPWFDTLASQPDFVEVYDTSNLPEVARDEGRFLRLLGAQSAIAAPLRFRDRVMGYLGVCWPDIRDAWPEETKILIQTVCVILVNVLERERVDRELRESEATARAFMNATSAPALLFDNRDRILAVNDSGARYLGGRPEALVGREIWERLPQELRPYADAKKAELLASREAIREQLRFGEEWFLVTINPLVDENGETIRVAVFAREITDIKTREEDLRDALRRVQEAELLKSRFLANMSHEIRTPLNHVIGLTSILLMQPEINRAEREAYLRIVKRGGESVLALMTAILDLSKIESGRIEPSPIEFDFAEWTEDMRQRYQAQVEAKRLDFVFTPAADAPQWISGDPVMMEQVLNNLVDNAVKFTRQGSVTLAIAVEERRGENLRLAFAVTDTGIGIEAEKCAKIFAPFFQVDSASTREYQGAGLGLTISKELVRHLGGEISVTSAFHEGSTFRFTAWVRAVER